MSNLIIRNKWRSFIVSLFFVVVYLVSAYLPAISDNNCENGRSNDISIINLENHKVTKSVAVGRFPWGIVSKP